jgi:hypothetical protein
VQAKLLFHSRAPPGVPLGRDKTVLVNYASFVRALPQLLMYALGGYSLTPKHPTWMIDTQHRHHHSVLPVSTQLNISNDNNKTGSDVFVNSRRKYTIEQHANCNWISSTFLQLLANRNTIVEVPEVPLTSRHGCLFRKKCINFLSSLSLYTILGEVYV